MTKTQAQRYPMAGTWNTCPDCGGRLRRERTKIITEDVRMVYCVCAQCGSRRRIMEVKPMEQQ